MLFKHFYIKKSKINKVIKRFINFNLNFFIYNKIIKNRQPFLKIKIKILLKIKLIKWEKRGLIN